MDARTWTVGDLLKWTESHFRRIGLPTPRLDAELLLGRALNCRRLDLYTGYRKMVEPAERSEFRDFVARRARREPVAYILGEKEFYSLQFAVSPAVLIPRPESEHLVEEALRILTERDRSAPSPRALDLGTGSGNLAVALAVNEASLTVDAVDASRAALELAAANASRHEVTSRVRLLEGDLYDPLEEGVDRYAVIVSNPPYVAPRELETLIADVRDHEPLEALLDARGTERDGLGYHRAIAQKAAQYLEPGGSLLLEVGVDQAKSVCEEVLRAGLKTPRTVRDYGGIERVVIAFSDPA